jgi:PAS domain S-box-containing protein
MDELLKHAPCGFLTFADDGTIVLINDTLSEGLGYEIGELQGKSLETILSVGGRVFYHTHFFPLLKMQGYADEIYFSLKSKDGADTPVLMNAARHERDGRKLNDCIFVRMRQRRRYEDELLRARKEAEFASEAKAKFISMMSHDLRTPLQAISGYADLLAMRVHGELNEDQLEDVRAIKSASGEMLRLMNDILSFAQLDSGHVEVNIITLPLGTALDRAEALLRLRFQENGLTFDRTGCSDDVALAADPDRFQQILLNLLTNAIKFTASGGTISVACESAGNNVAVHVRDTGVGIPKERIGDVFEPFVQIPNAGVPAGPRGVGLGLAISRDLARAMGGDLSVTSTLGQGSDFVITLPAAR